MKRKRLLCTSLAAAMALTLPVQAYSRPMVPTAKSGIVHMNHFDMLNWNQFNVFDFSQFVFGMETAFSETGTDNTGVMNSTGFVAADTPTASATPSEAGQSESTQLGSDAGEKTSQAPADNQQGTEAAENGSGAESTESGDKAPVEGNPDTGTSDTDSSATEQTPSDTTDKSGNTGSDTAETPEQPEQTPLPDEPGTDIDTDTGDIAPAETPDKVEDTNTAETLDGSDEASEDNTVPVETPDNAEDTDTAETPDGSDDEDNTAPSDAEQPDSDVDETNPEPEQPPITEESPEIPAEEVPAEEEPLPEVPVEEEVVEELPEEEIVEEEVPAEEPIIDVVVPAVGSVIINPYKLNVKLDDNKTSREQIIHQAQVLTSNSNVPVLVNATVTGAIAEESKAVFVSKPPEAKAKEIFMYVEFQPTDDNWIGSYTGALNQMIVTADGNSKDAVMTLDAGIDAPAYGAYRLFGALSDAPDEMWSSADGIEVNVAFTFSPLESPEN